MFIQKYLVKGRIYIVKELLIMSYLRKVQKCLTNTMFGI